MRVLVLSYGTRGDVQPMAALGHALRVAGHEPLLAAPASFAPLARGHRIPFAGLDEGVLRLWSAPEIQEAAGHGRGGLRSLRAYTDLVARMRPAVRRLLDGAWAAARDSGAELLVHSPVAIAGPHLAERLGIPAVVAALDPLYVPTREFANPLLLAPSWLPASANRLTHLAFVRGQLRLAGLGVDRWRAETLGLPRRRHRYDPLRRPDGRPTPVLNQVSRHVLPPPADWPPTVHTTGYWYLPTEPGWAPPPRLAEFVAAGPPPVYVGFGSVVGYDPAGTAREVLAALDRAGVRAVLATGWGGLAPGTALPESVLAIDSAPHDWLLPRMSVVVHHAGGTTWTAAAAGRPQVVCPAVGDQPFWARRMHALGVAPPPVPAPALRADRLAGAIRTAYDDVGMADRAARLGALVRAETGAADAVAVLEKVYAQR
ncbi:glycosyltransferase [Plantactinospora endophytica]|uniref:Glycosyl transferase family 1 n=1 Tax=Plantactinospora endophytica TaxID=673535 RepID=A0ABQ4E0V6_9ACTN|nr:glycosyltransferase [Plantactinospora endophytica]GIG88354.1 glycosyl transferase family 1 [Plantactinospora endophytica]